MLDTYSHPAINTRDLAGIFFDPLIVSQRRCAMVLGMTKPITDRPLRKAGRKPTLPPGDAGEIVTDLAADGWSVVGIAHRMGVDIKTFNLWLEREPSLRDAITLGRERERQTLHNIIYRKAVEKDDITAAIMLLNSRHGYRSDQSDQGGKVNVTIALPGAMTLQQFTAGMPALEKKGTDHVQ